MRGTPQPVTSQQLGCVWEGLLTQAHLDILVGFDGGPDDWGAGDAVL